MGGESCCVGLVLGQGLTLVAADSSAGRSSPNCWLCAGAAEAKPGPEASQYKPDIAETGCGNFRASLGTLEEEGADFGAADFKRRGRAGEIETVGFAGIVEIGQKAGR